MYPHTSSAGRGSILARWLALAAALGPLTFSSTPAAAFIPRTVPAFANGDPVVTIATDASDPAAAAALGANLAPPLANAIGHGTSNRYAFTNFTQPPVLSQVPQPVGPHNANPDYSPLWQLFLVTWKNGTTPTTLRSEAEVLKAEMDGKVTIAPTQIVIDGPVVSTPHGGSLLPVTEIDGFALGDPVQTLITDTSDASFAAMNHANFAPKLAAALGTKAALDLYKFFDSRHNPGQGTFFDTRPIPPGPSNSNSSYTPLWNVVPVRFLPQVPPPFPLVTSSDQLDMLEGQGLMSEGPDPGIAVSCPIVGAGTRVPVPSSPNSALMTIAGGGDQATLKVGDCIQLHFMIRLQGQTSFRDVTDQTSFFEDTPGAHGSISGNIFCATKPGAFPVHGRFCDPLTGICTQADVHLVVH